MKRVQDVVREPTALSKRSSCDEVPPIRGVWIPYNPAMTTIEWESAGVFEDIRYEKAEGIAKITINRPEVRNAFRPLTVIEMQKALEDAREDHETGVIILTGEG